MVAPDPVKRLVERFNDDRAAYEHPSYVEASVRQDFLDPFFRALGWDVGNRKSLPQHLREVQVEGRIQTDSGSKAPDYTFRIGGITKFFVEAKRPAVRLDVDVLPALQVRRYGWNAKLAYSVLTDFQELSLYDTRIRPNATDGPRDARLHYLTYDQYVSEWDWISQRFSRQAVASGELDRIAADVRTRARSLAVDNVFLEQIEEWRKILAKDLANLNSGLSEFDLSTVVQVLLDRIVFLRICEDRGIEPEGRLKETAATDNAYAGFVELFYNADARYNSGLFHLTREKGRSSQQDRLTPTLTVSDSVLREVVRGMYWPHSSFDFRVLGTEILGNVYEQFLGSVIRLTPKRRVKIEQKPEVRKSTGVVYTPALIVRYILDKTISVQLASMTLATINGINRARDKHPFRIVDPSCGSGSFLIEVYQRLLDWYLESYIADISKWSKGRDPRIFAAANDDWRLTTAERKRILIAHVFGVDIDPQAVEVAKMSLLLKVLEEESAETLGAQMKLLHERALPDLDANIRCGNSLVDSSYFGLDPDLAENEERSRRINPFDWASEFPEAMAGSGNGFDLVLGNPPYVLLQDEFRDPVVLDYYKNKYKVSAYKVDTYHLFMERAVQIARPGGYCSMITPTNYLTNNNLRALRRMMIEETQLEEIAVVDKSVFSGRSVDTAIFVLRSDMRTTKYLAVNVRPGPGNDILVEDRSEPIEASDVKKSPHLLLAAGGGADVSPLLERMSTERVGSLGDVASVNFGKQLRDRKKYVQDVIDLAQGEDVPPGYAKCYTGSDIRRWAVDWNGLACLKSREAKRGGCWNDRWQDGNPKLLCRQIGFFPEFAMDSRGFQCLNTLFMVNVKVADVDPWFLLGVLNASPLRSYWIYRYWDKRRTFPKVKGTYLKELPLPARADEEVAEIAKRMTDLSGEVARPITTSRHDQLVRSIDATERALDLRVAELFNLSAAEHEGLAEAARAELPM